MGTLLSITLKLLKDRHRDISYGDIAKATGLSRHWIVNLSLERAKSPDVNKVQKLYEYLSKRELQL